MNCGSALAALLSPLLFGWIIDATGNWQLPFIGTIALMGVGIVGAFFMHPERRFVPLADASGARPVLADAPPM